MKRKKIFVSILLISFSVLFFILFIIVGVLKVVYPVGYEREILKASKKFDVDSNLVRAVIKVESGYNPLAVSKTGARGLMQLMPDTAFWIADELGFENFSLDELFLPEKNIEMGVFYLSYLSEKYDDITRVLFSYNAGEGKMNDFYSKNEVIKVESIEIIETKQYISNVKKAYNYYETLCEIAGLERGKTF